MPVDTRHPEYLSHAAEWCLMRDVVKGQKAIQAAGVKYLPKLSDQNDDEYKAYKGRATFFNATGRVVDAMIGMVFRKDPTFENEKPVQEFLDDMTLAGVPFNAFAQDVLKECLEVNRAGVLVDFPNVQQANGKVITLDIAQKQGLRVYATKYRAEQIINWRSQQVGGKTVLTMVVLEECVDVVDPTDPYCVEKQLQFRVLMLDGSVYRQEIWQPMNQAQKSGKEATQVLTKVADFTPLKNSKPLDYIPFVFFSSKGNEACVEDSITYDLAVVNLAHYRNDADLEHGLHFTGLPTPVVTGVEDTNATYRIGSGVAWGFSNPDAKAFYLEFTGAGLGQLRTAKLDKEAQMAALGARMLAPEKKDAESADSLAQKRQGENSALGCMANSCSRSFRLVLQYMADWAGLAAEVTVKLNTDYIPAAMAPQQVTALLQAVVTGNLSQESFFNALVKGEVISSDSTFEDEQARIAEDAAKRPDPVNDTQPEPRRNAA
jgi:hypothetical protein